MKLSLGLLVATPAVFAHNGRTDNHETQSETKPMRPHTHIAYHHVEAACSADVEKLCTPKEEPSPFFGFGDPFLDWVLLPMAPPPIMLRMGDAEDDSDALNLGALIDEMMDRALNTQYMMAGPSVSILFFTDNEEHSSIREEPMQAEHVMDNFINKLAEESPDEIPQLAQQLIQHGEQVLQDQDVSEERRHLARRLTEVRPDHMRNRVHLPFGCPKNRCLMEAAQQGRVSQQCAHAMMQLDQVQDAEFRLEQQQELFLGMMWMYIALLSLILILLARRYRRNKANRRLKRRILQAVYANPSLKAQLEQDLGESVGSVPPVSNFALRMMSEGGRNLKEKIECAKRIQFVFFIALFSLVFYAPFWVLPICILLSVVRAALLCCVPEPIRECTCCCCGASTEDVANGTLTEAQACCGCCKGTGICSVACADCCGTDDSCCGDNTKVAGCCCCCGASTEDAKNGTLTQAQACCSCCSGTGCCTDCGCYSCCSPKKGQGQKHVFQPTEGIYEGVPIQVV